MFCVPGGGVQKIWSPLCEWLALDLIKAQMISLIRNSPLQPLLTVVAAMRIPFTALLSAAVEHVLQVTGPGDVLAAAPHLLVDAGAGRVSARLASHARVRPLDIRHLIGYKSRN